MNTSGNNNLESWKYDQVDERYISPAPKTNFWPALIGVLIALAVYLVGMLFLKTNVKISPSLFSLTGDLEPYTPFLEPEEPSQQIIVPNPDFTATQNVLETLAFQLTQESLVEVRPSDTPTPTMSVTASDKIVIPAGSFIMGASSNDPDARDVEKPQHEVYLDTYTIDAYAVSNIRYDQFVRETGYQTAAERNGYSSIYDDNMRWVTVNGLNRHQPMRVGTYSNPDHPVVHVDFYDAYAYCKWAGGRLPTDAEWEKAARGNTGWRYPWGDNFDSSRLVYAGSNGPQPVDSYANGISVYGLYHMSGNVFEWTMSYRSDNYYEPSETVDVNNVQSDRWISLRGGAWTSPPKYTRVTHRDVSTAVGANHILGFRCVYP